MATPAALPPLPFNPSRVRSYVLRLPLFTRLVLLAILVFWILELQTVWSVVQWGSLAPDEIGFGSMYRLNTYPFIHAGFFHAFINMLALTPLLERFEAEHGTLTAVALFIGQIPLLWAQAFGSSFFLAPNRFALSSPTRTSAPISLGNYKIPTWTSPLVACVLVAILMSNTSFLGHMCAILVGYLLGLGYLKLFVPPEKILRWVEGKLNLLGRLPHYVSVDQKTYATIRKLRNNPHILFVRLPYILSLLCIVAGVVWLLLLPLDEYSRRTYISENALLPGQVHAYFSGSEQHIFRGYKKELESLLPGDGQEGDADRKDAQFTPVVSDKVQSILRAAGLKVATQNYEYVSSGVTHQGQNTYGIIRAPRGDATEAIVLVAAWRTADDELNLNGVTLALTLARYFKRWSLWSKDIIFLFPRDSKLGTQAWIDAYHDMQPASVQPLPLKSGALQGGLAMEYPFDHRFDSLHIVYDGVNGQLPNLDLFNTAVSIASGQMGIGASLQEMWDHDDSYEMRLQTILRGMVKQGFGYATGAHSSFMPYHIDAITLQTKGDGWQDEMALGRTIEGLCRSLNNLLEHLHQSFFFYLLMQANRFVSIGTYLPSAMLIAGNFTIMAIALWMRTGYYLGSKPGPGAEPSSKGEKSDSPPKQEVTAVGPSESNGIMERQLALPLTLVVGLHLLGLVPLYIFNNLSHQYYEPATYICLAADLILPLLLAGVLSFSGFATPKPQQYLLIKSFSLLLLGLFLSTLATLNFSLSFMIGLLCAPLTFVSRLGPQTGALRYVVSALGLGLLNLLSPPVVLLGLCAYMGVSVEYVLTQAAFGWNVWGMWTQVVVWCVWWPAWLSGCALLGFSLF
ncbi:Gaa1-like protein [Aspergillus floccosus]